MGFEDKREPLEDEIPAEDHDSPPGSAMPPRVVAETPVGLTPPQSPTGITPPQAESEEAALGSEPALVEPEAAAKAETEPVEPDLVETEVVLGSEPAAKAETEPVEPDLVETEVVLGSEAAAKAETEPVEPDLVETEATTESVEVPQAESAPPVQFERKRFVRPDAAPRPADKAAPAEPAAPAKPADWDEEISPELAGLLFGGKKDAAPRRDLPAAAPVSPVEAAPVSPPEPAPAEDVISMAEPIHLTDIADARTLPITAGGVNSPAPNVQPDGKARYQRLEEPLKEDRGQRTVERWDYRGPDLPAINNRQIKLVRMEEITYTDGSWYWRYDREYTDKGRDRREIRANKDHTFIQRADEVTSKDPATDKRVRRKEQEGMILAGPVREEKRSLLSWLFKRGNGDNEPVEKSWRPATPDEQRRARRQGGGAF